MLTLTQKPFLRIKTKKYYVFQRDTSFLTCSFQSKEIDALNLRLPKQCEYPSTALLTFAYYPDAESFYDQAYCYGKDCFPTFVSKSSSFVSGKWQLEMKKESNCPKSPLTINPITFDDMVCLTTLLHTNLWIIQKHQFNPPNVQLYGSFLPILSSG